MYYLCYHYSTVENGDVAIHCGVQEFTDKDDAIVAYKAHDAMRGERDNGDIFLVEGKVIKIP